MKTKLLYSIFLLLTVCLTVKSQTLDLHHNFDNNLTDSSTNGYTLTAQGSFTAAYENDRDVNAMSAITFPGANGDYLLSNYTGVSGTAGRSITAWVKTTAGSGRNTIVSWGVNASETMFNVMIEGGEIRVEAGASNIKTSGANLADGNWHHIAVTFADASTLLNQCKLYVDAAEVAIGSNFNGTRVINTTAGAIRIGQAIYGTDHYFRNGALDDVRVYSSELTSGDIVTISGISAATPVAAFSASNTTPTVGEIITFTDASTNSPTSWAWDFGSVTVVGPTTIQSPQISFQTAGTYTITLTATNAGGSDDEIKTDYITVSSSGGSGDLQARYNFDGDITDASSYGRDLITQGSFVPAYENDNSAIASSALTTSGVYADHLLTGYSGVIDDGARTVAAWFNVTGTSREPIISWGKNSSGEMFNVMIENGVPRVEAGASSLKTTDTGLTGAWHHIAVTYDPADGVNLSDCKIYIDGSLSTNEADVGASFNSETTVINTDGVTNFLKIGSSVYSTYAFDGALNDVRIYSKALTAGEVTTVMGGGTLGTQDIAFGPNEIKAFPNAVTDILNIETSVSERLSISVYNLLGKQVKRGISSKQIDMSELASGLYVVKVRAGVKVANLKIVKK